MSEKDNAIQQIAGAIIESIKSRKSAVVFVRCPDPTSLADAEQTLSAFNSHIRWISARLTAGNTMNRLNNLKNEDPRTVVLVHPVEEAALRALNDERSQYDAARIRSVFLLTSGDVRQYARTFSNFWNNRDCFAAWPAFMDTKENAEDPTESYENRASRGIVQRVEAALNLPAGYERGKAVFTACRDAFYSGNPIPASQHMVEAISDLREEGKASELAEAFEILGSVAETRNDLERAYDWFNEAMRFWQQSGAPEGMAGIYARVGALAYRLDDIDTASRNLEQAVEIEETLGNSMRLCDVYRHMGMIREREDALTDAERFYNRAEKLADEIGDDIRMAKTLHHQARLQERYERWSEARDIYNRALTLKEKHQDRAGMAATYHQLGNIYYRRAEHDQSMSHYEKAIALEQELGDEQGLAASLMQLAHVAEERFQHHIAYGALYKARPILRKLHSPLVSELEKRIARVAKLMTMREIRGIEDDIAKESGAVATNEEEEGEDQLQFVTSKGVKTQEDFAEELAAFKDNISNEEE